MAISLPFQVVKSGDNGVVLLGYDGSTRLWYNILYYGDSQIVIPETYVNSISQTGYLCVRLRWSGGTITPSVIFSIGETPPSKDNTYDYIVVRRIVCSGGIITEINDPVNIVDLGGKVY